jgi:hypothetical protein
MRISYARFEVSTAFMFLIMIFWDVTLCCGVSQSRVSNECVVLDTLFSCNTATRLSVFTYILSEIDDSICLWNIGGMNLQAKTKILAE